MPIEAAVPKIDNRRFDDIVAEARTRIPRYTPEWTDLNDNDPGMTLVQLFAWMCDLLLYRLGKVPELNYLKFLQLVGIELLPAEPASTEITFPLLPSTTAPYVIVPAQTPVAADVSGEDRPVIFETTHSLIALAASLTSVQVLDGYSFLNVTPVNEEAQEGFQPFGPGAVEGSALLLGFDYADLFPELQLDLAFFAAAKVTPETAIDCGVPATPSFTSATIAWEYWGGTSWQGLSLLKDETQTFLRSGHVVLRTPAKGKMVKLSINGSASLYWIRARLTRSSYDRAPQLLALRTNTVRAIQAETVRDEVLGGSNGDPNQVLMLANKPVLAGTLTLEIDEGSGFEAWTRVEDFFGSTKDDKHYVLNRTTGEIRFGDGTRGAIPVANVENPAANVVARIYQFGGGTRGNVAAGLVKTPLVSIAGLAEDQITNLFAATDGRNEETLDQAKERAPATLKAKCRAVTAEDFEELAKRVGTVKRAKALPLYHPGFPGVQVPGVVTVIVIPENDQPNPMPSEGTIRSVCAFLNQRRLLTTEVYVIPPEYHQVEVRAEIIAGNTADLAEVKQAVEDRLTEFFSPLKGGNDGLGWPFGGDIFFSLVYQRIFGVAGVRRVEKVTIVLDGEEAEECRDVAVPTGALLFSDGHDIQVNYAFDEE
jgi:predicted phage baseplate assembly protein